MAEPSYRAGFEEWANRPRGPVTLAPNTCEWPMTPARARELVSQFTRWRDEADAANDRPTHHAQTLSSLHCHYRDTADMYRVALYHLDPPTPPPPPEPPDKLTLLWRNLPRENPSMDDERWLGWTP